MNRILATALLTALAGSGCSRPAPPNVLLLVIDTLRADRLGCYGYFRDTSPHLDRLAAESLVFDEAFCGIPITLPSHASILTGLYPQQTGILRNYGRLDDGFVTLAEKLSPRGYRTGAVVSTAVLKKDKNLGQGFDVYLENWGISDKVPREDGEGGWRLKGLAEDANRMALDWLEQDPGKPFFLLINYYDVHAPYVEIEGFRDLFDPWSPEMAEYIRTRYDRVPEPKWKWESITFYDRSLAYLDAELGKFFSRLRELGLWDNTVVIVTSDHGNGLYQHGDYWSHGEQLYDGHIRIPLILRLPGGTKGRVTELVETVDFFPSVLELLGLPGASGLDGKSFLPLLKGKTESGREVYSLSILEDAQGRPLPRRFAVRSRDYKLIHSLDGESSFFRLTGDPYELAGGAPDGPEETALVKAMRNRGINWYQRRKIEASRPGEISADVLRELRALGYITD